MTRARSSYDENSIQHFKGLEGVRNRPGMYLGERGNPMVRTCIKELVDNALDEYLAGRNKAIEVWSNPAANEYIVADSAEGIPVGLHKTSKVSTLTLIFSELHAGGKFNDSAYKSSAGTHGVGAAAVNAVSETFEVWTCRSGEWYHQSFKKGAAVTALLKQRPPRDVISKLKSGGKSGTIIRLRLDQSIVSVDRGKTKAKLDLGETSRWLKNIAMLNKGLTITLSALGKTKVYQNKVGLVKILKDRVAAEQLEVLGKPAVHEGDKLSMALQWTSYSDDDGVKSYVSCSPTRDGGSHVTEFVAALVKSLEPFKGKRDKFTPKDLQSGLIGVINWNMNSPEFSSQVKDRLTSNLAKELYAEAYASLTAFFESNKTLARRIIKRASEAKKAKEEFRKVMDGISKVNQGRKGVLLPNILTSARKCTVGERELFIVEGDSAAGTAKKARNPNFQEVMKLTGKPTNGIRKPLALLLKSKPVLTILSAIGYDHRKPEPHKHLRVGTIFCLADADPDGSHINALILTVLHRMVPKLFEEGRVYICNAPLFSAYLKGKRYFGATHKECHAQMPSGTPKDIVVRSKGWGELPPEVLEIIAFHPETRNLIKVGPPKDKKDLDYYLSIMGNDTAGRKTLLGL